MLEIAFLLIYVLFSDIVSPQTMYYILIIQGLLSVIIHIRKKKSIDAIFIFYIGMILTNIANISLIGKIGTSYLSTYNYIVPRYIGSSVLIWCIYCTVVIFAYHWFSNKSLPSIGFEIKNKKHHQAIFILLLSFNIMALLGGHLRISGVFLKVAGLLNTMGILYFSRIWSKENNKRYRTYAITLCIITTYVSLLNSFLRSDLIIPTFCLFLGYFIGKDKLKYFFSFRVIPFLIVIFIYASVFSSLQKNRSNFISVFTEEPAKERATDNSSALLVRSANIAQLTNVIKLVKQNGFYQGRASAPLVLAFIPRFLWANKPTIALGSWFALEINAAYKDENGRVNNSINMTIPGELYLDFGWAGVLIGSLFMGALIAAMWNATEFHKSQYNLGGTLFGGYLLLLSMSGFGGDLQIVITLFSTYFTFFVIKKLAAQL